MKIVGIVLAGGFGVRLRKYLPFSLPKCLLPCKGRPLVCDVVEKIVNICEDVYILVNRVDCNLYERFLKIFNILNNRVKLVIEPTEREEKKLGSVGALYWFVKGFYTALKIYDYVFITPCDIYFVNGEELMKMVDLATRFNTVVIGIAYIYPLYAKHFGVIETRYDIETGVEKVVSHIEKPVETVVGTVHTGLTIIPRDVFTNEVINYIEKEHRDPDKLGNFISYLHEKGYKILTHLVKQWIDVGVPELYEEYERICLGRDV